jgi:hypothetical protein
MSVTKMNVMKRRVLAYRMWTGYEIGLSTGIGYEKVGRLLGDNGLWWYG